MKFDLLIPTRFPQDKLFKMLKCVSEQTILPQHIFILVDSIIDQSHEKEIKYFLSKKINQNLVAQIHLLSNLNNEYIPWQWIWNARKFLIKKAISPFVYMIDDDNEFDSDFFERTLDFWSARNIETQKDLIVSPYINYRRTTQVQSYGFRKYSFLFSKLIPALPQERFHPVMAIGWNSLFGALSTFKNFPFDESFAYNFEDVDFAYTLALHYHPIEVIDTLPIYHMERNKSYLEKRFVSAWTNPYQNAYQKWKNRILFVKKHANFFQRIAFYGCGLWLQTLWFIPLIFLFASADAWKPYINWLLKGTFDWLSGR